MIHENRFIWLDLLRGLSALAVCAGHLRSAIFTDFSQMEHGGLIAKAFYFATGLGHQAVIIFFVLSGFFVGGSIINRRQNFNFGDYALARLSRIWVVLIPALAATFLIDQITSAYLPELFLGKHYAVINSGPTLEQEYSISASTFLANIFFLQTIYSPVFGSNGPLWSLANEFWYYVFFPLGAITFGLIRAPKYAKILSALIIITIIQFISKSIMEGFIIWLLGVIVFSTYSHIQHKYNIFQISAAAGLFIASLFISKIGGGYFNDFLPLSSDIICAIFFCLFLISINDTPTPKKWGNFVASLAKWLADISYSLYLFHFPVVLLIYAAFYSEQQLSFGAASFIQFGFWLSLLIAICHCFWWMFEKRTDYIRMILDTKVFLRKNNQPQNL